MPERTEIDDLDDDIALAWLDVLDARQRWAHSPNGETVAAEEAAVAKLDELLEFRHLAAQRRGMPVPQAMG